MAIVSQRTFEVVLRNSVIESTWITNRSEVLNFSGDQLPVYIKRGRSKSIGREVFCRTILPEAALAAGKSYPDLLTPNCLSLLSGKYRSAYAYECATSKRPTKDAYCNEPFCDHRPFQALWRSFVHVAHCLLVLARFVWHWSPGIPYHR